MKISDVIALGLPCPPGTNPDAFAWSFLETECPEIEMRGFPGGPGTSLEARALGTNRYLILQTGLLEGLEDLFMGEIVTTSTLDDGFLCLDEIELPFRLAHYECSPFSRDSADATLVAGLGGEWESILNGYLFFVHIPLAQVSEFEKRCGTRFNRLPSP